MSFFNLPVKHPEKKITPTVHPWAKTIKTEFSNRIKHGHNSVKNVPYHPPHTKERVPSKNRVTFTVLGNMMAKEFLYCVNLVQSMHKYRWKKYGPPVIKGVTAVEWEYNTLIDLKANFGDQAHCLESQVAILRNNEFFGGEKELKELLETDYYIHQLASDFQKECVTQFAKFVKEIGRPCAYLHISINKKPIGSMIFMLYSDIVPQTCENFLRLCQSRKGGYSGTPVHRVVKDGWIQCGGFGLKDTNLECENFIVNHDRRGVIAMANAGRHLDCSTQFFVLLQPNPCFKLRFVAFGQMIDGEETLKKIEGVETYYEAPVDNIIIYRAGELNLKCQDIRINKGAREYIDKHIEDLNIIGKMFYKMLLDNVFLEIEFRKLQKLEANGEEELGEEAFGETVDEYGNYIAENIRATRRFMRKKEKPKSETDESSHSDKGMQKSTRPKRVDPRTSDNNDFDVESYSSGFAPEEHRSYSLVSPSFSLPKPEQPYYLALTDVPYPGEVDSTFDLKRFLQGDYCLESDLNKNLSKVRKEGHRDEEINAVSQIISSYGGVKWLTNSPSDSEDTSSAELDSDEEMELKKFLMEYGEKVSYSGRIIKEISKKHVSSNPVEEKDASDFWNDEEIRRMRLAMQDYKTRMTKKVSISVEPWEVHGHIKRRMTGFEKPKELSALANKDIDDDDIEDDEYEDEDENENIRDTERKQSVSIYAPNRKTSTEHKIKRRQTGFVTSEDLEKLKILAPVDHEDDDDDDDENPVEKKEDRRKTGVRIAPPHMNTEQLIIPNTRKSVTRRKTEFDKNAIRPSVLIRLYDDIAIDDKSPMPTLKDYKPMSPRKKSFAISDEISDNPLLRRTDNYLQQLLKESEESMDKGHGKEKNRKSSLRKTSFESTHGTRADKSHSHSIRSLEYARNRPSLSVQQYQNKVNEERRSRQYETPIVNKSLRTGLRLPGDSPVYDTQPSDSDLHSHGSQQLIKKLIAVQKKG